MSKFTEHLKALQARRRSEIEQAKTLILSTLRRNGAMKRNEIRAMTKLPVDTFKPAMAELNSEKKLWSVTTDGTIEAAGEVAKL
jgi:hypothetical protein